MTNSSHEEYLHSVEVYLKFSLLTHFSVKVLNCRIIFLHEVPGHELNSEGGLAHAARAEDDHLKLLHVSLRVCWCSSSIKRHSPGQGRVSRVGGVFIESAHSIKLCY